MPPPRRSPPQVSSSIPKPSRTNSRHRSRKRLPRNKTFLPAFLDDYWEIGGAGGPAGATGGSGGVEAVTVGGGGCDAGSAGAADGSGLSVTAAVVGGRLTLCTRLGAVRGFAWPRQSLAVAGTPRFGLRRRSICFGFCGLPLLRFGPGGLLGGRRGPLATTEPVQLLGRAAGLRLLNCFFG